MFQGQDAWRRHPNLAGCWKRPFPGLGTAVAIFSVYCIAEAGFNYVTAIAVSPPKDSMNFEDAGSFGDNMPTGEKKRKAHH